jgi:signal transduction histidine kinase/FixJ family two-component response regulator
MTLKRYTTEAQSGDGSTAARPQFFAAWSVVRRVHDSLARSFAASEPIVPAVAAFGVFGMPLYYLVWQYVFPQAFESLELRLVGSALCLLTCSSMWWPESHRRALTPIVWYFTVTYCLPFFFTFMLLANGGSAVWLVTWLLGFMLLAMVAELAALVLLLSLGVSAACAMYFLQGGELAPLAQLVEQVPVFLFTVIAGTVSIYRQQVARETLMRARDAAEAANKAKSEFLAMMSHEIRTPMNGVLGMTGLLADTPLSEEQKRSVSTIRECGEGLMHIINDILDFSKLEAEAVEVEEVAFDLHALLTYAIEIVTPRANARGLRLQASLTGDVPKYISSDAGRLRQVVLNLLGNAVKFTERGSVRLLASVTGARDARRLRIEVQDTGIGIAPEKMARLFNSFTQADSSISRRFGGSGLGLAISKKLVQRMGGEIGADSVAGKGSTFWLEIPLTVASEAEAKTAVGHGSEAEFKDALLILEQLGRPLRLLVAEDNATNQVVVKAVLAKYGIRPDVVGNGVEAVDAARRAPYDAVLMDIHMPEMDGFEATRAIRMLSGEAGSVPVIALTANALSGDHDECRTAGMNAYVSKPFRTEELIIAIAEVVGARAGRDAPSRLLEVAESATRSRALSA